MARIRTIKPEFFTNSKITKLTPLTRLFYVSLWCEADRLGRMKWDAETLKDRYFPRDKCNIQEMGDSLAAAGLVRFYEIDGQAYLDIPGFREHQVINNREAESSIPAFNGDAAYTRESGVKVAACGKEGRKEGTTPIVPTGTEHELFSDFWKAYPSRGQAANPRKPAVRAHLAAIKRGADPAELVRLAPTAAPPEKHGTEFVPMATTWLNEDRWKDRTAPLQSTSLPSIHEIRRAAWKPGMFWDSAWGDPPKVSTQTTG